MNGMENDDVRMLLEEIRRTISGNRIFLRKLKGDDAVIEMTEDFDEGAEEPEENFEEL